MRCTNDRHGSEGSGRIYRLRLHLGRTLSVDRCLQTTVSETAKLPHVIKGAVPTGGNWMALPPLSALFDLSAGSISPRTNLSNYTT